MKTIVDRQPCVQRAISTDLASGRTRFIDSQTLDFGACELRIKDSVEALRLMHRMDDAKRHSCRRMRISIEFPCSQWELVEKRKGKQK